MNKKPLVIAHRGYSSAYPENTMLAFEKAITECGCNGLELDVQLSKDGEVVVIHDDSVDRTTNGFGLVTQKTYKEIRKLDAGVRFGKNFAGEKIPNLKEVLELVKRTDTLLNIELKYSENPKDIETLANATIALIREYQVEELCLISTFNIEAIVYCAKVASDIKTGLLYSRYFDKVVEFCVEKGISAIHPHFMQLHYNPVLAHQCRKNNIKINAWTVNFSFLINNMFKKKITGVITNYPNKANKVSSRYRIF